MTDWRDWVPTFDRIAPTYDRRVREDAWLRYEDAWGFVERTITGVLGDVRGRTVLDVGCGTAEFLRRWHDRGAEAVGVEPSEGMRVEARRKVPAARILAGDLCAIPLPDGGVDAALVTYTFTHLSPEERPAAIAELRRVVHPAGVVAVVDVAVDGPEDLPRVRDVLVEAGRSSEIDWYEAGYPVDLRALRSAMEEGDTWLPVARLGPTLCGIAWVVGRDEG